MSVPEEDTLRALTNLKILPYFSESKPDELEGFYIVGGEPPMLLWPDSLDVVSQCFLRLLHLLTFPDGRKEPTWKI